MTDGVFNINKPEGWTSQDVCTKLRHRLHIRRIGHTGTLDPMATGVLPVCTGKATRIIEYYDRDMKSYHAAMQLGIVTDTLDITGDVTGRHSYRIIRDKSAITGDADSSGMTVITEEDILKAFADYTGCVSQIPPKYSALRVNGRRAYDLARQGSDFELKSREIFISSNTVSSIDADRGIIEFDVTCSKGTYIRTICDDIGRTLGCGAVMSSLVRTGSGYFRIDDAVDLAELISMDDSGIEKFVIPMEETLVNLGRIDLKGFRAAAFQNGNHTDSRAYRVTEASDFNGIYRVYSSGVFLGTGHIEKEQLIPDKVIRQETI
jgi:tRNA pseudouridine55 synthase